VRVEHQQTVTHVVERGIEAHALPAQARPIDEKAGRKARRKAGEKTQRADQDDQSPIRLDGQAGENTIHMFRALGSPSPVPLPELNIEQQEITKIVG
jgi:hypothetical protein